MCNSKWQGSWHHVGKEVMPWPRHWHDIVEESAKARWLGSQMYHDEAWQHDLQKCTCTCTIASWDRALRTWFSVQVGVFGRIRLTSHTERRNHLHVGFSKARSFDAGSFVGVSGSEWPYPQRELCEIRWVKAGKRYIPIVSICFPSKSKDVENQWNQRAGAWCHTRSTQQVVEVTSFRKKILRGTVRDGWQRFLRSNGLNDPEWSWMFKLLMNC